MVTRDILDLSLADLEAWCAERDDPRYRAAQIAAWIYQRGARDFAVMTNVSRALREDLAASFRIGSSTVANTSRSHDTTEKLLVRLRDGAAIESVGKAAKR